MIRKESQRRLAVRTLAAGAVAVTFLLSTVSAAAAAPSKTSASVGGAAKLVAVRTYHATDTQTAGNTSPQSVCLEKLSPYGYDGWRVCDFDWFANVYSDGNIEYFVVGSDFAIWHIWRNSGGWKSLGGHAKETLPNGVYEYDAASGFGITTIGANDGKWWCRDWPWNLDWYAC
jgi:hypothetical protein